MLSPVYTNRNLQFLSFPVQHNQSNQTNQNPDDIHPRDFVFEQEKRHRDKDQRGGDGDEGGGDAKVPARAVHEQIAKFDADDSHGESDACPVEFAEFGRESILDREENEGEESESERDGVGHQKRDGEVDVRWRAFSDEVIQRAGRDGEGNGEVEEEHVR